MVGSFPMLKKVSTHAYHINLPSPWNFIHPVFHILLLEPVKTSTIPNQHQEPPPSIMIKEEEEWEVSQILDSKLKRRTLWHLVEWKGFSQDSERFTWEPAENLNNCPELVNDFHSLYPDKPGPNSSQACILVVLGGEKNYHLRPYPAIIGLPGQFPYPQPPGLYLCFWAWGVLGPLALIIGFGPTLFIMGA
ncbi:hypothetical protein O181_111246 [Austropuccinia psidii MF-1]|uniref:Chromo domain-containing protein n=1 Tax=Austropuccinia psidii MF-1 TaxID=1389203 RepID=A0A9Q3K044_9BASI|nr:hypothetical protein [Austropuccinia psidii MF-1]